MVDVENFGAMVKRGRRRQGWTQRDLATQLKVGQQAVSGWERGVARPETAMVRRIANLLGIDVGSLLAAAGGGPAVGDAAGLRAPVRPLATTLPLQELAPDVFEQFSADLTQARYPRASVHRYGGQGHTQGGIDVIVNHADGKPTGIQCKREQKFGPAKVAKAVADLTIDVDHCYMFLTRVASPQARQEIAKYPLWTLWDVEDLSREVRTLADREAAVRLVDAYFPGWREQFLGVPSSGPWLTTSEFFRPFLKDRVYSHAWQFVGRAEVLSSLRAYVTNTGVSNGIAFVVGWGGLGKTRLLRAFAEVVGNEGAANVRFLETSAVVDAQHFEQLPPDDKLVVVIDDAHDRTDNAMIISGVQRARPGAKVLLALRPYGRAQLLTDLRSLGVHPSEIPTCTLTDLTVEDAQALAESILGDSYRPVGRRLGALMPDCPLLIVVGATLIKKGELDPQRIEGSEDVRSEILRTFGTVMLDTSRPGDVEDRREVLKAVSILQPFRMNEPEFQAVMAALTGKPFDQMLPHLRALQDAGVLLRRGESVRIVPDLLGDIILADAAIDGPSGASTGYLERVCQVTSDEPLVHAVVNASRVDWQTAGHHRGGKSAVDVLWTVLISEFLARPAYVQCRILNTVRQAATFQPNHAMTLVCTALASSTETEPIDGTQVECDRDDVFRELPQVLYHIALNIDHLAEAADLLWELARDDTRPPQRTPNHPVHLLTDLAEYAVGKPIDYQLAMIAAAERWLQNKETKSHAHSPFAVLGAIFATEVEQRRTDGFVMTFRAYPLNVDAVRPVRERVLDLALSEARVHDVRRAVQAITTLQTALRYPAGRFGRALGAAELASWTPIFVDLLSRLARLAASAELDPIVIVTIRKIVRWHAQYAKGETKPAAQAVLAALPDDTEHKLAHVLHDGWDSNAEDVKNYGAQSRRQQSHFKAVAAEACNRWSVDEVVDRLVQRLVIDRYAYDETTASPAPFVWTLVRNHPEIGVVIADRVANSVTEDPASEPERAVVLRDLLATAMSALAESLPAETMRLARALINTLNVSNARAVAHAFGRARGNRATLLDGEVEMLRSLVVHEDPHVRRLIVGAAWMLGEDHKDLAGDLVTSVQFSDSELLAADVTMLLAYRGTVSWKQLSEPQMVNLFNQLHDCPSMDDYHITQLLAEISAEYPDLVLQLLIRRVERSEQVDCPPRYQPLPYQWNRNLQFRATGDFERYLRYVLNWIAENPRTWARGELGAEIFAAIADQFDDSVLRMLSQAMNSGSVEQLLAVSAVLRTVPRNFTWTNNGFVSDALRVAQRYGSQYVHVIGGALHSATTSGIRSGTPGAPYAEDVEQHKMAAELAASFPAGSIEREFYSTLASAAEFQVKDEIERDVGLGDRRRW